MTSTEQNRMRKPSCDRADALIKSYLWRRRRTGRAELQGGLASCKVYIDAELLVVTVTKKLEAAKNKAERDRAQQQKDLDAGLEKKCEPRRAHLYLT